MPDLLDVLEYFARIGLTLFGLYIFVRTLAFVATFLTALFGCLVSYIGAWREYRRQRPR